VTKSTRINPSEPLTHADIQEAIEASEYPFELELFQALTNASLNPVLGFHTRVTEGGEIREIDLLASLNENITIAPRSCDVSMRLLIAAKKLHTPQQFVGIAGEAQSAHSVGVARTYYAAGIPSQGLIHDLPDNGIMQILHGPDGFGETMSRFVDGPVCAHWAIATRKNDGKPWASGNEPVWQDFDTLVRAATLMAREYTAHRLQRGAKVSPFPSLHFSFPMLIIDTPHLFLYHPSTKKLEPTQWLVLHRMFDVGNGDVVTRSVDIVARSGIDAMIERFRDTAPALRACMERHYQHLESIAHTQKEWWDRQNELY
jgi:hypothetical protein